MMVEVIILALYLAGFVTLAIFGIAAIGSGEDNE